MTPLSDLSTLIINLPHPILIVDQDQRILLSNQKTQTWNLDLSLPLPQLFPLIYQSAWSVLWNQLHVGKPSISECKILIFNQLYRIVVQPYTGRLDLESSSSQSQVESSSSSFYCIHFISKEENRWNRLLLSRTWCLKGLKHDFSNRIFLLSALPQLVDYSEPAELLNDLTEDLPSTLEFFTNRLDLSFTENLHLHTSFGFSKEDQKKSLSQSLSEFCTRFKWVSNRSIQVNDDGLNTYLATRSDLDEIYVHQRSLGLGWSLHLLALLFKQTQLNRSGLAYERTHSEYCELDPDQLLYAPEQIQSPSDLTIYLDVADFSLNPPSHRSDSSSDYESIQMKTLDLDQKLLPHVSCLFILLQGGGIPWSQWQTGWQSFKDQDHSLFDSQMSLGIARDLSWQQQAYHWIETWINASLMLQGGVISIQQLKTLHPSLDLHSFENQDGIVLYFPLSTLI